MNTNYVLDDTRRLIVLLLAAKVKYLSWTFAGEILVPLLRHGYGTGGVGTSTGTVRTGGNPIRVRYGWLMLISIQNVSVRETERRDYV